MDVESKAAGDGDQPDEVGLAVLVACHHRGPLSLEELARLLASGDSLAATLAKLAAAGWLEGQGRRYAITQSGRDRLDQVLEGIESHLSPDDPAYVRRYRREDPSLPFDTNTVWAEALCVNYHVDPAALRPLIPVVFELDLFQGRAYVSLTASRLKDFGVGWIPGALRMNFYQATYRAHVTFTDFRGRRMRGCYFVRSETNSALMSTTANLLPEFRAHHCSTNPILMVRQGDHLILSVDSGDDAAGKVVLVLDTSRDLDPLPASSLFPTRAAAYDFIVDFHDAFSYNPATEETFILRIERGEWHIRVVEALDYYLGYFHNGPFNADNAALDSVFYFTNCPYRWLPLVKERVKTARR